MSDAHFEKLVSEWLPAIESSSCEDDRRRVMKLFAKEVERECRHKASKMAGGLANAIHNMRYDT